MIAGLGTVALAVGIVATVPGGASADPVNPTDGQLSAAAKLKQRTADEVGALSAQVAVMQSKLNRLLGERELAEQKLALALSKLEQAKQKAIIAKANVAKAAHDVQVAQDTFDGYMQAVYTSGDLQGMTGALLTASDPNILLQRSTLEAYQSSSQITVIDQLGRATVAKSNADASARLAVQNQKNATDAATSAKDAAVAAVNAAQAQQAQMQAALAHEQDQLQAAQLRLATLNNQRAKFLAFQAQKAAEERARREEARRRAQQNQGGGGNPGSGGGPAAGSGGSWTAAKGQIAANRAKSWEGWPYAWAGGNASGPTRGVCAGDGAFNDCNVVGFDCSGLVLYAWAQISMDHYAASQYSEAGSFHPSLDNLMPGDLVFWGYDGTIGSIHHVAIYIGGGYVVQAPESGSTIQETPLYSVSGGVMHATRPLT